ncbi:MAG: hypothetical protein KDI74_11015 [Gammaproteobacteria bacterium]|nr:hypothetical protein [Gammaproteobacteria bacterium]
MKFQISDAESHRAKIPHEIFLTNLIGNHILWFIAALGMAKTYWQPLALVPLFSVALLVYTLWRARLSRQRDSWFVMCHWQICAGRSRIFIIMLMLAVTVSALGWVAYSRFGLMKEAVYALIGGLGILPIMVTVLVLILMESDALHQAALHKLPDRIAGRYPNPGVPVVEEEALQD